MTQHYAKYEFMPVFSGNTFKGLTVEIEVNDEPLDLSGCRIIMHLKRNAGPNEPVVFSFDTEEGSDATITILDAAAGRFRYDSCIMDIPPFEYVCDTLFIHEGEVKTRIVSTWSILKAVTFKPE